MTTSTPTAPTLDAIRDALPEAAKDLKLNIQSVLANDKLTKAQALGCALASAYFLMNRPLADALLAEAAAADVPAAVIDDAKAAAAIMGMNTIYYRFRHMAKNPKFAAMPPRLRMNRMNQPATSKADFELFAMSCAVLEGCEMCVNAHEQSITKHGYSEEHAHEAVRIAAAVKGLTVAMGL